MANPFWTESIPLTVTNKTANGEIATFSVSGWIWLLVHLLILLNVLLWSVAGLVMFGAWLKWLVF